MGNSKHKRRRKGTQSPSRKKSAQKKVKAAPHETDHDKEEQRIASEINNARLIAATNAYKSLVDNNGGRFPHGHTSKFLAGYPGVTVASITGRLSRMKEAAEAAGEAEAANPHSLPEQSNGSSRASADHQEGVEPVTTAPSDSVQCDGCDPQPGGEMESSDPSASASAQPDDEALLAKQKQWSSRQQASAAQGPFSGNRLPDAHRTIFLFKQRRTRQDIVHLCCQRESYLLTCGGGRRGLLQ